jgi:hypothetical protein
MEKNAPYQYIRLKQYDKDGVLRFNEVYTYTCLNENYLISTFPNPSLENFSVLIKDMSKIGVFEINIYDINSKLVFSENIEIRKGTNIFKINKNLMNGLYFIQLKNDEFSSELIKHVQR